MRKGGGQKKGAAYERKINTQLSLWLSSGEKEDVFKRSSMSGGRATVAKKKGKILANESGDAAAIDPLGFAFIDIFYLEYKCYNDLNLLLYIFKGGGKLKEFWKIACEEAEEYSKQPVLIFKQNRSPDMILIKREMFNHLRGVTKYEGFKIRIKNRRIFELDEFLRCYKFKG